MSKRGVELPAGWDFSGHQEGAIAAVGTAISGSNLAIALDYLDGQPLVELKRGAAEYNSTRTGGRGPWGELQTAVPWDGLDGSEPVLVLPRHPFTANAHRVLSVLKGQWVRGRLDDVQCASDRGSHAASCGHREGRIFVKARDLAQTTFGLGGGSQRQQAHKALEELFAAETGFLIWDAQRKRYLEERGRVLEYRTAGDEDGPVIYEIAFGRFLLDSLLRGHYTTFPVAMTRELSGTDFLVALHVLSRPATAHLDRAGQAQDYAVTRRRGAPGTIPPRLVGLGHQRPDKLRKSLERAAVVFTDRVGPAMGLALTVEDATTGGLNLRLIRTVDRSALRQEVKRAPGKGQSRTLRGQSGTEQGQSGTEQGQSGTRIERESVIPDRVLRQGSQTRPPDYPLRRAIQETFPDIAALKARGWPTVSAEQRGSLDKIAARHDQEGRNWAARIIEATPLGEDPLRRVFDADSAWQAERYRDQRRSRHERDEGLRLLRGKAPMQPIGAVLSSVNLTDKLREQGLDESLFPDKPERRKGSASEDPAE